MKVSQLLERSSPVLVSCALFLFGIAALYGWGAVIYGQTARKLTEGISSTERVLSKVRDGETVLTREKAVEVMAAELEVQRAQHDLFLQLREACGATTALLAGVGVVLTLVAIKMRKRNQFGEPANIGLHPPPGRAAFHEGRGGAPPGG